MPSPTIYLDNAATSWPKPPIVAEAMSRFLAEEAANPGRGGHRMAIAAEHRLDLLRDRLAKLINAESPDRLALMLNCTDALNNAIHGVLRSALADDRAPDEKPHIITTVLEHNSISRPIEQYAREGRITFTRIDCDESCIINPADVLAAITPRTIMIAVTHAANVLGTLQPIAAIGSEIRAKHPEVLLLVDAAQSIGAVPIDVQHECIDLLAFPGHKALLGPTGTGALYIGRRAYDPTSERPRMLGYRQGGTGGDSTHPVQPRSLPHQFEGGTPNTVGYAGLLAAIDTLDPDSITHERALVQMIMDHFKGSSRVRIPGPDASQRTGAVSLILDDFDPMDAGAILDQSFNIAVRPGLHCAPYCHQMLGTFPNGTLRLSPGPTTSEDDVTKALEAIDQILM